MTKLLTEQELLCEIQNIETYGDFLKNIVPPAGILKIVEIAKEYGDQRELAGRIDELEDAMPEKEVGFVTLRDLRQVISGRIAELKVREAKSE